MNREQNKPMESVNPFAEEAAVGAAAEALRKLEWEEQERKWKGHVEACEVIMRVGVMPRLELAAAAVSEWGWVKESVD